MRRLLIAGLTVAMLTLVRDASAFCRTTTCDAAKEECRTNKNGCVRDGVPVIWAELPITYRFSKKGTAKIGDDDEVVRKVVKRAFDRWAKVECSGGRTSVRFVQGADITTDKPLNRKEGSQPFGIYFRDKEWPHGNSDESLALTNQIYGLRTGTIDYADIEVNTALNDFSLDGGDGIDFESVMTHEAGHYLGLAHSNVEGSIMVARYCQDADRCNGDAASLRELSTDDRDAVCAIYPPDASSSTAPPVATGCATTSTNASAPGELVIVFGLAFAGSALVRRRVRSS